MYAFKLLDQHDELLLTCTRSNLIRMRYQFIGLHGGFVEAHPNNHVVRTKNLPEFVCRVMPNYAGCPRVVCDLFCFLG